jgi:uncharacterized ion transporter superfamily protein YfcC
VAGIARHLLAVMEDGVVGEVILDEVIHAAVAEGVLAATAVGGAAAICFVSVLGPSVSGSENLLMPS